MRRLGMTILSLSIVLSSLLTAALVGYRVAWAHRAPLGDDNPLNLLWFLMVAGAGALAAVVLTSAILAAGWLIVLWLSRPSTPPHQSGST